MTQQSVTGTLGVTVMLESPGYSLHPLTLSGLSSTEQCLGWAYGTWRRRKPRRTAEEQGERQPQEGLARRKQPPTLAPGSPGEMVR